MSFGSKPCTCQGSNLNCYRCDGTGFIEQAGERNPSSSGSYKTLQHMCKCSACVPSQPSVSSTKKRVNTIMVKPSPPARKASWKVSHPCPSCDRKFDSQQSLFQHIEQMHGKILSLSKAPASMTKHDLSAAIEDDAAAKRIATPAKKIENDWENYCTEPDDPWRDYAPEDPYPQPQFICPQCGIKLINASRLEKHVNKVHAFNNARPREVLTVPELSPIVAPASSRRENLEQCPTCNQWVKKLEKHMVKTGHGSRVKLPQSPAKNKNDSLPSETGYPCPLCAAVMKNKQRLGIHIDHIHGVMAAKKFQMQQRSASTPPFRTTPHKRPLVLRKVDSSARSTGNDMPSSVYERAERMDATRGWGGSFRDNGQFGSYPLHDSMDDDSFA